MVSGAMIRLLRSVSGCSVRGGLGSKPGWCKFVGQAAKRTTPAMVNLTEARGNAFVVKGYHSRSFPHDDLGYSSSAGSKSETEQDPYDEDDDEAFVRKAEEPVKHSLRSKTEEKMRMKFDKWAAKNGRVYPSNEEKERRFRVFAKNLKLIDEFNSRKPGTRLGLNCFADRMPSERPPPGIPPRPPPPLKRYLRRGLRRGLWCRAEDAFYR